MSIVRSIIVVLIMLGVLATLHELGHFWVARLLKIKVFEVSIFVGPKLITWQHKDVKFSIRMIPICRRPEHKQTSPKRRMTIRFPSLS